MMKCKNCGHEINDNVIVCEYCGHSIPIDDMSENAKTVLKQNERSDESLKTNHGANIRMLGIVLMITGGLCDLIGMVMVGSGSLEAFTAVLIIGSVSFGLGLLFTFAFRG